MAGDMTVVARPEALIRPLRVIKRYSNRKLYDTRDSRYVTLPQVAEFVRAGEDVQVIDNGTKEDKTDVTLALIISEELRAQPRGIPLGTLKALIRSKGGKILNQFKDGPIAKLMPREGLEPSALPSAEPTVGRGQAAADLWRQVVDDRIRAVLPDLVALRELRNEVRRLAVRLEGIERQLSSQVADPQRE